MSSSAASAGDGGDAGAVRRLLKDPSPSARAAAVRRLAGAEDGAALSVLLETLADPHPYVRRAAAGVLGAWLDPASRRRGAEAVARSRSDVARREACRAFALWADSEGASRLRAAAADRAPGVRAEAARWLGEDRGEGATAALRPLLRDASPLVRAEAVDALAGRPGESFPAALVDDPDPGVRLAVLEGSAAGGGEAATVAVLHGLMDAVWSVRLLAAELAGRTRERRVLAPLVRALGDERERVRAAAHGALVALTGIPFDPDPGRWNAWLLAEGKDFDPAAAEPARRPAFERDAAGVTVAPIRFLDLPIVSTHVGFVIDASGSMREPMPPPRATGGAPPSAAPAVTRWEAAVRELKAALERLGGAEVNVVCFSDEAVSAFPTAARLTSVRRAEVGRWIDARGPAGRTALYDGIAAALADPAIDQVVVLSDGAPSAGSFFTKTDLLAEIRRLNRRRRARIDVVSLGSEGIAERWRDVLDRIAAESGGVCLRR